MKKIFLILCISFFVFADETRPKSTVVLELNAPKNYKKTKHYIYHTYFAGIDPEILKNTRKLWNSDNPFAASLPIPQQDILSLDSATQIEIQNEREAYASRVLRSRLDSGIRSYFEKQNPTSPVRKFHSGIKKLSDVSVPVSPGASPENRGTLRFGYDVFLDFSKLEYQSSILKAGVYQPRLLSSLLHTAPSITESLLLGFSANWGTVLPHPDLHYRLSSNTVKAGFSKTLSKTVSARLSTDQPVAQGGLTSYDLSFSWQF